MITKTSITRAQIIAAQGGIDPTNDTTVVWVECPDDYDASAITAEDIVHDGAIVVVDTVAQ